MTLPHGIFMLYGHAKDYVLKLINNIYGQKQVGKVFADYRDEKLQEINFKCLVSDECVFVRDKVIVVAYVDDVILINPCPHLIDEAIRDLISVGLKIEEQGFPAIMWGST